MRCPGTYDAAMTTRISHWIDGHVTPGTSGRTAPVFNPASGVQTGEVDLASAAEVDAAVASAVSAGPEWRLASLSRRAEVLFAFRELLHTHAGDLAAIITAEHGKTASDADGEIARGLDNVDFACGLAQLLKGSYSDRFPAGSTCTRCASRWGWSRGSRLSTSRRWCRSG